MRHFTIKMILLAVTISAAVIVVRLLENATSTSSVADTSQTLALLSPNAKIIERADLSAVVRKPRELVLWMLNPKKAARSGSCADAVYGDAWIGPTRLSLVDSANSRLLNTVEILGPAFGEQAVDSLTLPFLVEKRYYHVPLVDSKNEGKPRILNLRDLTGNGMATQFPLFTYDACGIVETSVLGYNQQSDRVVQYPIEVHAGSDQPKQDKWVQQVFARGPVGPGHWDFTWEPGHGTEVKIHEDVTFDRARQMFVERRESSPDAFVVDADPMLSPTPKVQAQLNGEQQYYAKYIENATNVLRSSSGEERARNYCLFVSDYAMWLHSPDKAPEAYSDFLTQLMFDAQNRMMRLMQEGSSWELVRVRQSVMRECHDRILMGQVQMLSTGDLEDGIERAKQKMKDATAP